MPGLQINSLDKIVRVYLAGVTAQEFTYEGEVFKPKHIVVSPLIFRGTTCPRGCGGCCFRFSLVWMPGEPRPKHDLHIVSVGVNGLQKTLFVDPQEEGDHFCGNLDRKTGLCGIHGEHPFTCDFELIRFTHSEDRVDIATRLFGRGWSYTRVTGQVGAMCDILPENLKFRDDAARKLTRLKEWADYFEIETHLSRIIEWVTSGPHSEALHIDPKVQSLIARVQA